MCTQIILYKDLTMTRVPWVPGTIFLQYCLFSKDSQCSIYVAQDAKNSYLGEADQSPFTLFHGTRASWK